jgi:hypothetical protein
MNSTPIISARIIRLTALLPPPPTPMTLMRAKFSESDRSGIGVSLRRLWGWQNPGLAGLIDSTDPAPAASAFFPHPGRELSTAAHRVVDERVTLSTIRSSGPITRGSGDSRHFADCAHESARFTWSGRYATDSPFKPSMPAYPPTWCEFGPFAARMPALRSPGVNSDDSRGSRTEPTRAHPGNRFRIHSPIRDNGLMPLPPPP